MRIRTVIVAGLVIAFAGLPVLAATAPVDPPAAATGDQKAARLDALFAQLKAAPTVADGRVVESEIVSEWLKSGDETTDAMMFEAITAMQTGAFNQALAILDKIVARSPNYVEGWNKRATVYYIVKLYDKSLADIEKTLQLEPRHFGALAGLGMIMIELGDKRRALSAFERALDVDPVINNGATVIEQLKDALSKDI